MLLLGARARENPSEGLYIDSGPDAYRRVAYLEAMANRISSYEKGIFPGLVQCRAYIEAVMDTGNGIWWDDSDAEARSDRVEMRLQRQRLVYESATEKHVHVVCTADAFNTVVGDDDVMARQFEHLAELIGTQPNLTVQLVPENARNNPVQHGGLSLFDFGAALRPIAAVPVVYGPATYFDEDADVRRLRRAFERVCALALSPEETAEYVRRRAGESTDDAKRMDQE